MNKTLSNILTGCLLLASACNIDPAHAARGTLHYMPSAQTEPFEDANALWMIEVTKWVHDTHGEFRVKRAKAIPMCEMWTHYELRQQTRAFTSMAQNIVTYSGYGIYAALAGMPVPDETSRRLTENCTAITHGTGADTDMVTLFN